MFQAVAQAAPSDPGIPTSQEVMETTVDQTYTIMQQQLQAYQKRLEESERHLQDFKKNHGIISLGSQINLLLQQRNTLDNSLKVQQNHAQGLREKLAWIKNQISHVPPEIPLTSVLESEQGIISGAKNNLLKLRLQEQELLNKYTEQNPHVQSLRKEMEIVSQFIKDQEANLAGSVTTGKNPLYQEMEMQMFHTQTDLVSAEAQGQVISQQILEVNNKLERLRSLEVEFEELSRQVKADERNYLNYLTKVGTTPPQDYQIQVGDQLDIKFFFNPELNESVLVRPDGRIALQLVGEFPVVGHTVKELREILMKNYSKQLKNPEVAVLLRSSNVPGDTIRSSREKANPEIYDGR
ncbi:polysaccharide biosynthesis/export family protein [Nitrospira sp. M1]